MARMDPEKLLSHREFVRALARALILDESRIDDVEQQTWVAALEHGPRNPNDERSIRAWLASVARNFARRSLREEARRQRREERSAQPEVLPPAEEFLARESLRQQVVQAVMSLAEPYRTVVLLRFFKELPPRKIASELGLPVETVKTRLKRGLDKLRVELDDRHDGDRSAWCTALLPLVRPPLLATGAAVTTGGAILTGAMAMKTASVLTTTTLLVTAAVAGWLAWPTGDPGSSPPVETEPRFVAVTDAEASEDRAPHEAAREPTRESIPADAPTRPLAEPDADPLAGERMPLLGLVLTPDGRPAGGAAIELRRAEWGEFSTLDLELRDERQLLEVSTADANGRFRFQLLPGHPADLVVTAEGYPPETVLDCFAGETRTIRLQDGATLMGQVRSARTNLPIANARFRGWRRGSPPLTLFEGETGADGSFEISALPPGNLLFEVHPRQERSSGQIQLRLEAGQVVVHDVRLEDGVTVRGRITDAQTDEPIRGAILSHGWTFKRTVTSDADGRYELPGFGAVGIYDIHVRARGYGKTETGDMELDPELTELTIDFQLRPARQAIGRVVDPRGLPVEGAYVAAVASHLDETTGGKVWWSSATHRSDWNSTLSAADGTFRVNDLRPDARHALLVRRAGLGLVVVDFPANEPELAEIDLGELLLPPSSAIHGRVVDENGLPVAGCRIDLRGDPDGRLSLSGADEPWFTGYVDEREIRAGPEGRFRFLDVAPGTYRLTPSRAGENRGASLEVVVELGTMLDEVVLTVQTTLSISGQVLDPFGKPMTGVLVMVQDESGEMKGMTSVDVSGRFVVHGLQAGQHLVTANPISYPGDESATGPVYRKGRSPQVLAGTSDLLIRLEQAERVFGRVLDAADQPVFRALLNAVDEQGESVGSDITSENGTFAMEIPPGATVRIEVQLTIDTDDPNRLFQVVEGPPAIVEKGIRAGGGELLLRLE